jgi:hypothetical protein
VYNFGSGLPDFSCCNKPKRGKTTKWPQNVPNGHQTYQMVVNNPNGPKHVYIVYSKALIKCTPFGIFCFKIYHMATLFVMLLSTRVTRVFIFLLKLPIWVYFGGSWNGKCWYILWPFGIFNSHMACFMAVWYCLCSFGIVLVCLDLEKSGHPALYACKND